MDQFIPQDTKYTCYNIISDKPDFLKGVNCSGYTLTLLNTKLTPPKWKTLDMNVLAYFKCQ